MKQLSILLILCSALLCEGQTRQSFDEERFYMTDDSVTSEGSSFSNPITKLITLIIFGYYAYLIVKWFSSKVRKKENSQSESNILNILGNLLFYLSCIYLCWHFMGSMDRSDWVGDLIGRCFVLLMISLTYWYFTKSGPFKR